MADKYYAQYNKNNGDLYKAQVKCLSDFIENIEITKDVYGNFEKYMYSNGKIVENPEYPTIYLNQQKEEKNKENDTIRDDALNAGVTYEGVLFDSDTDQKANLIAMYQSMDDDDTILWYGKNNQGLLCTKTDIAAIGALIAELHTYMWNMNAYIKEQIANAADIEELAAIEINYTKVNE